MGPVGPFKVHSESLSEGVSLVPVDIRETTYGVLADAEPEEDNSAPAGAAARHSNSAETEPESDIVRGRRYLR